MITAFRNINKNILYLHNIIQCEILLHGIFFHAIKKTTLLFILMNIQKKPLCTNRKCEKYG